MKRAWGLTVLDDRGLNLTPYEQLSQDGMHPGLFVSSLYRECRKDIAIMNATCAAS